MNVNKIELLDFYEFIYDRQLIWHKRFVKKEPSPWTNSHYFINFKFCNVYRELDKGSIVLIEKVLKNKELSLEDKILNIFLYRRFNTVSFFDMFGVQTMKTFDWKRLEKRMDEEKKKGNRLFNDAYIICQRYYTSEYRSRDKHVQQLLLIDGLRKEFHEFKFHVLKDGRNYIKSLHEAFVKRIPMTGNFLAYQYCTDISYIPELKNRFIDLNDFVAMGPGSIPGVHLLFPGTAKKDCGEKCKQLWMGQEKYFYSLMMRKNKDWSKIRYKTPYDKSEYLSLSNIQNCLCEFRKRVMLELNPNKKKRYFKIKGER